MLELGVVFRMQDLIRSVDLKLARADSQVGALADQISAWTSGNPINVRVELREGRLGYRLILQDFAETAPLDDWGLLIGECVHNLRSALDNLAFALARLLRDPPSRPEQIAFPIYQDRSKFEKHGRVKLDQMPPEAGSLIERLQPYQRDKVEVEGTPDTDALVRLQLLNNQDKHRIPSVVLIVPESIKHAWHVDFQSEEDARANEPPDATGWLEALYPGVVLLEYRTNRPIAKVTGNFDMRAVVSMQITDKRAPAVPTMRDLSYYTALIVAQFRGFFE